MAVPSRKGEIIDYEKSLGGAAHMRCADGTADAPSDDYQEAVADVCLFATSEEFEVKVHQWINHT